MAVTTAVVATKTIRAAGTSNAAGATTRDAVSKAAGGHGGKITLKLTNGATPPSTPAEMRVMISHSSGSTPATGAAGAEWKTLYRFRNGLGANQVTERDIDVGPEARHVQIEVGGNTGQAVTGEAIWSEITGYDTTA